MSRIVNKTHAAYDAAQTDVMIRCCVTLASALGEDPDKWDPVAAAPRWARYILPVRAVLVDLGMPSASMIAAATDALAPCGLPLDAATAMHVQNAIEQVCTAASLDLPALYEPNVPDGVDLWLK